MEKEISSFLFSIRGKENSLDKRKEHSIHLASLLLKASEKGQVLSEKMLDKQLQGMMQDFKGRVFTTSLTDLVFRSGSYTTTFSQISYLIKKLGVPKYLPFYKRFPLFLFRYLGRFTSFLTVPLFLLFLRKEMSRVVLNDSEDAIKARIKKGSPAFETINLNHLGEAILGEQEAKSRLNLYLKDLKSDYVEYISIKISTLYSQINLLSYQENLDVLASRLRVLLRESQKHFFVDGKGRVKKKFVNLDMEEYRDLHLTVSLFKIVLDEDEFLKCRSGIVLQAYLPDSYAVLKDLVEWSKERIKRGGVPVKIRLVKGANLANEKIEASLKGWPQAPFKFKSHVDAQFKIMLDYAFKKENAKAVNIGVGSHNLFDISYALILRAERKVEDYVNFEMLEGMANHLKRVVNEASSGIVLYSPAASENNFHNAIAYLIRRFDENTGQDNFLKHFFGLRFADNAWEKEEKKFLRSFEDCEKVLKEVPAVSRTQNRLKGVTYQSKQVREKFYNESDTDFTLKANRKWAEDLVNEYAHKEFGEIPLVVAGKEMFSHKTVSGQDPSTSKFIYQAHLATDREFSLMEKSIDKSKSLARELSLDKCLALIENVEKMFIQKRGHLIACSMADGGKVFDQADAEVSEAIDFLRYYRIERAKWIRWEKEIDITPRGCVVVASPWNFPVAIAVGGILGALLSQNAVIFKPSLDTALVGYEIAKIFWDCGLPRECLQFFLCDNEPIGSRLISSAFVDQVILTGSTNTAKHFIALKPGLQLCAETGGKNAMVVSNMSDRDLAIKSVIDSAFGHSGQKCSACSLLICEKEVYRDSNFVQQLYDAASSLKVGSVWDLTTKIGPLIRPPGADAINGLTFLEGSEEWLLLPEKLDDSGRLWSPSIKRGVKEGSFSHLKEFFVPLLSMMEAENLDHAIKMVNSTSYGLTSGLQSLDEREHEKWKKEVHCGNLYINRGMTGAIVRRQPFGGVKESNFGIGFKAGGPNYLLQFSKFKSKGQEQKAFDGYLPEVFSKVKGFSLNYLEEKSFLFWKKIMLGYEKAYKEIFSLSHDFSNLLGQDNLFTYLPKTVAIRLQKSDSPLDFFCILGIACLIPGRIKVYTNEFPLEFDEKWEGQLPCNLELVKSTDEDFINELKKDKVNLVRFLSSPSGKVLESCSKSNILTFKQSILSYGRLELSFYFQEQSLSYDFHRYGNLGIRERQS
ncbi:Uncharacterized protein AB751O23_BU_00020 [Chlamydiales bacterium SCGC AB-751-O23]|jgi:RHH-type transcriptional regulator, proline utilization regulon repressor / proline dehydrogenase / delta 1-pyrroline-5-carboxylate dehydrogenase|nr:Uncharacterized protein AB751O23_BU_00020 [Chlamydiales bacterium SCGC AB-751-O23]